MQKRFKPKEACKAVIVKSTEVSGKTSIRFCKNTKASHLHCFHHLYMEIWLRTILVLRDQADVNVFAHPSNTENSLLIHT